VNRVKALKTVDAFLGRFAVLLLALLPKTTGSVGQPSSILLIRPGGIGDAALLIPAVKALKRRFPQAEIHILAERRNAAALALCPDIGSVLRYDILSELRAAICGSYDLVIDTEQWHRLSAVVARLCRPKMLIGFGTNERGRLFTHAIPYSHDDYEVTSFLRLLEPLGIGMKVPETPFLVAPADAAAEVKELLAPLAGKRFVTIFPGASIPERRWGAERFRLLAERVCAAGYPVVVVGGREDRGQGEVIVSGGTGLNLAGLTPLTGTAAVLERSCLLVGGDSGVLHLAVGLGVPTVSLFGPGRALKWAPRGENHFVINRKLPCSPCTTFGNTPPCPTNARCMAEITVDEVLNGVILTLAPPGAARPLRKSARKGKKSSQR